jgi:CPA2 family monovalent cation:H+ antiporter-2
MHSSSLISTIVVALVLAFAFGALAHRLKVPPLVGYLLAGVAVGPFTPGFVADQELTNQLAEIGVILLMFGVGLHVSPEQLMLVKTIAIPGALAQMAVATLFGMALGWWLGWPIGAGLVFGLALSVASTVVVLRVLQERRLLDTDRGRLAVGWLVVEDIAMVLALVLLPPLAGILKGGEADLAAFASPLLLTVAKIAAFIALMLIVGTRVIPWMLHWVAHTGSRELFRLSVLAIALGVAFGAAELFDVSFALGAFLAGMILSESALSQRAASESLPLRDAFAVLFFVSVGMLFDPMIVVNEPAPVLATVVIIMAVKAAAGFLIMQLFGQPRPDALLIAASRAQIGEFSFILAGLGTSLALLPDAGRDLILAGAIISIVLNPLVFRAVDWLQARPDGVSEEPAAEPAPREVRVRETPQVTQLSNHVVLVGHGRVGSFVSAALIESGTPCLVIEENSDIAARLRAGGLEVIDGNAADPEIIRAANLVGARCVLVAIPDVFEGGQVIEQARALNPALSVIARAHAEAEVEHLAKHGASAVIMGEHEIAKAMIATVRALPANPDAKPS